MAKLSLTKLPFILFALCLPGIVLVSCGRGRHTHKQHTSVQVISPNAIETIPVVPVKLMQLDEKLDLPGELAAYENVPIHAKVEGFISWIGVDRGSLVRKGQLMIKISCPELNERIKEASAKVNAAEATYRQSQSALEAERAKQLEAKAKLDSDKLTFSRLQKAALTPGAIAQNEVDIADKTVEADQARLTSCQSSVEAAKALVVSEKSNVIGSQNVLSSVQDMSTYLDIRAPFDGVITERNVHQGSIVAVDAARSDLPLVRIQDKAVLRLVVAIPEDFVSGLADGMKVPFSVPAYLGKTFFGTMARLGYALDTRTRTMPVELDVINTDGRLEPGMFATIYWTVKRPYKTFFVPSSAVASDLKGTFVVMIKNGVTERVPVKRGQPMENWVEIVSDVANEIKDNDYVALEATDELKTGTHVETKVATQSDLAKAMRQTTAGGE